MDHGEGTYRLEGSNRPVHPFEPVGRGPCTKHRHRSAGEVGAHGQEAVALDERALQQLGRHRARGEERSLEAGQGRAKAVAQPSDPGREYLGRGLHCGTAGRVAEDVPGGVQSERVRVSGLTMEREIKPFKDHDQRFKTLLKEFLPEFFELFFSKWAGCFEFTKVE